MLLGPRGGLLWIAAMKKRRAQSVAAQLPAQSFLAQVLQPNDGDDQQLLDSKGTHHAQFGSTTGADVNDPTRVPAERVNRFTGNDYLFCATTAAWTSVSVAIVIERLGTEDTRIFWNHITDDSINGGAQFGFGTGAGANKVYWNISASAAIVDPDILPTGQHLIIATGVAGFGTHSLYVDNTLKASGNMNATLNDGTNPRLYIGSGGPGLGQEIADCKIGTMALWTGYVLDATERAQVRTVLKTVYPSLP